MSHDHGGGSQDYVGMGKSVSCHWQSMTDARERGWAGLFFVDYIKSMKNVEESTFCLTNIYFLHHKCIDSLT